MTCRKYESLSTTGASAAGCHNSDRSCTSRGPRTRIGPTGTPSGSADFKRASQSLPKRGRTVSDLQRRTWKRATRGNQQDLSTGRGINDDADSCETATNDEPIGHRLRCFRCADHGARSSWARSPERWAPKWRRKGLGRKQRGREELGTKWPLRRYRPSAATPARGSRPAPHGWCD